MGFSFSLNLEDLLYKMKWKNSNGNVFVVVNHPHQLLRNDGNFQFVWQTRSKDINWDLFLVRNMEVLRRRNKGGSCFQDWKHYDELVLKKHLEKTAH